MRPIDADALERDLFGADWILDNDEHMVEDILRKQPTIDAVPVVHGDFEKHPEEVILNLRVTPFLCKTCRTTFITLMILRFSIGAALVITMDATL